MSDRFWVGDSGNWSDNTNHWSATSGGAAGATKPTSSDNVYFDDNSFTSSTPTITQDEIINCLNMDCTLSDKLDSAISAVFESATTYYTVVAKLDTDKAVVVYCDVGNGQYPTACVLSVSGNTITSGTPVVLNTSATNEGIGIVKVSTDKMIVTYNSSTSVGNACILSISGTTITVGNSLTFENASISNTSVTLIDTDKAIVAYLDSDNSYYGTACVLNISGTTITAGTPVVFESNTLSNHTAIVKIDTNKAIVNYTLGNPNYYGKSCVLSVSGTVITAGVALTFRSDNTSYVSATMLATDKIIVAYSKSSTTGASCILSVSGTTVTAGPELVFSATRANYISIDAISALKSIVSYQDEGNSNYGTCCLLGISGTTITSIASTVFESDRSDSTAIAVIGTSKAIAVYKDYANSSYGTSIVIDIAEPIPEIYCDTSAYLVNVYGNLNISSAINFTGTYGGNFVFKATTAGKTIKTDGSIFYKLYFSGDGGKWTFQDNVYTSYFDTLSGADITLNLDTFTVNVSENFTINASITLTAGTSTIIMSGDNTSFNGGGKTYHDVELTGNAILITGSNTYSDLKFTAGKIVTVTSGSNQTLTTMSGNGTSGNLVVLNASIYGIPFTITNNTVAVTVNYYSITDCTATSVLFTANYSIDISGNTGWLFTSDSDYSKYDSIYRGNALHIFDVDKNTWFAWKENITSIQEGYDETIFIRDIDGFNYEQSETYYTRDRDLTNAGVYVDIPWEFITKSYMGGISQKQTLTDISLHYKCSTNATVNLGYSEQSTNLLSTSFHSLAATSDFTIDNKDHIKRILIPSTALQNVDYYNLRFNGTGKFTLYGMEQNFRVKKR